MLNDLFYIVWEFDPVMFSIGSVDIRYYGLTWALTILLGERFFSYFARREGFGPQIVETGFIWITLGNRGPSSPRYATAAWLATAPP